MNNKLLYPTIVLLVCSISGCFSKKETRGTPIVNPVDDMRQKDNNLGVIDDQVNALLSAMSLEEKLSLVHASGKFHINGIERLGIPEMWLSDGPHGVRHEIQRDSWSSAGWTDDYATYLPHLTSVAASWDTKIATLHGQVLGSEARHRQKDFILGPGVNLARLPLYGRNFEYMGEDPILAAKLVVPQIKAIQSHDVAATIKHYALNTQELNRTGVNAKPDERTLREVYLPAFEYAVKEANVYSVMGAYNEYYGTNANQSKHLVMDILKGEWGFKGVLLTDWNVDINTYDAAMNGLDLEMGTDVDGYDNYYLAKPLQKMIENGKVPVAVLDDKVTRILRTQYLIGMYNKNRLRGERNSKKHQQAAKEIASAGIVLLKNETNLLPLTTSNIKNILVLGPNADKKHGAGGGSSEVKSLYEITPLQGLKNKFGKNVNIQVMRAKNSGLSPIPSDYIESKHWTGTPAWTLTKYQDDRRQNIILEDWVVDAHYQVKDASVDEFIALKASVKPLTTGIHTLKIKSLGAFKLKINGEEILAFDNGSAIVEHPITLTANKSYQFEVLYDGHGSFTLGWDAPGNLFSTEQQYTAAAKKADVVIYFGGLSHADDRESLDRKNMLLPNEQDTTIKNLLAVNNKTIVFLIAGSAVEMPWVNKASTIVWGWYGGMEAGNAFADMLTGDTNPSGKMPITLPKKLSDTAPIMLNDYNEDEALYKEGVFIGYRWFEQQNIKPNFVFGHGLSYSTFTYSDIKLSTHQLMNTKKLTVTATITNNSKIDGAEVVQLYLHDKVASVDRPYKELKAFDKVFIKAGESQQVSMILTQRDLSFWDIKSNDWLAEVGEFEVLLGSSVDNIKLKSTFNYID
ncbi:MAG: beta-glucosidase [Alteromonadaceae bacterium]|jgi:beta-glucosidase